jgi:hypothetical protein
MLYDCFRLELLVYHPDQLWSTMHKAARSGICNCSRSFTFHRHHSANSTSIVLVATLSTAASCGAKTIGTAMT